MAYGRQREGWNHTANLLALQANCHRDPKRSQAFNAQQFHPFEHRVQPRGTRLHSGNLKHFATALVGHAPPSRN